jgi:anaerobic glycerol-3-phosphate dehydrogenase
MKEQKLPSLEEIRKKFKPFRNVNIQHKAKLSKIDKVAIWITTHVGSM